MHEIGQKLYSKPEVDRKEPALVKPTLQAVGVAQHFQREPICFPGEIPGTFEPAERPLL